MDLVQDILESDQEGGQQWTIWTEDLPQNSGTVSLRLKDVFHFRELCSVTIIVQLEECSIQSLQLLVGKRLFNPADRVLFILDANSESKCAIEDVGSNPWEFEILTHVYLAFWETLNLTVRRTGVLCGSCENLYHTVDTATICIPGPGFRLIQLQQFSEQVRAEFVPQVLFANGRDLWIRNPYFSQRHFRKPPCEYFYPTPSPDNMQRRRCDFQRIFVEHLAARLNLTLRDERKLTWPLNRNASDDRKKSGTVTVELQLGWKSEFEGPHLRQFLALSYSGNLFYCTTQDEREAFNSWAFWMVPFEGPVWALLAASIAVFTILLNGNWLDVLAALVMRQSHSFLNVNRIMILLALVSIVITCAYESIISSHLTSPPPVRVHSKLKDLLDNGYKIFGFRDRTHLKESPLYSLFHQEKLTDRITNSFTYGFHLMSFPDTLIMLSRATTTCQICNKIADFTKPSR
jgi:hypothetical protein